MLGGRGDILASSIAEALPTGSLFLYDNDISPSSRISRYSSVCFIQLVQIDEENDRDGEDESV
jgi:hypothetical protein